MPAIETLPITQVAVDETIDPRLTERSMKKIEEYADNIENLPPILVDHQGRILDGIHRYEAHKLAGLEEIKVKTVNADTRQKALLYAAKYNSQHGVSLTALELKKVACELYWEGAKENEIATAISRSTATVHAYLKKDKEKWKKDSLNWALEMREDGLNQGAIAKAISDKGPRKVTQPTISNWFADHEAALNEPEPEPEDVSDDNVIEVDFTPDQDAPDIVAEEGTDEDSTVVESEAALPQEDDAAEIDDAEVDDADVDDAEADDGESRPAPWPPPMPPMPPITPRPKVPKMSPPKVSSNGTVADYLDEDDILDDTESAMDEIADYDIPDIDDVEFVPDDDDEQPLPDELWNSTEIYMEYEMGVLKPESFAVARAIGLLGTEIYVYLGEDVQGFLEAKTWTATFTRTT